MRILHCELFLVRNLRVGKRLLPVECLMKAFSEFGFLSHARIEREVDRKEGEGDRRLTRGRRRSGPLGLLDGCLAA